jgi:hypothetical protein
LQLRVKLTVLAMAILLAIAAKGAPPQSYDMGPHYADASAEPATIVLLGAALLGASMLRRGQKD